MAFELSLISALLIGASTDFGCGGERPPGGPGAASGSAASTPHVETVPVSTTLTSSTLICPRLKVQAYPGYYIWDCRKHYPTSGGGYDCDDWDQILIVDSGQQPGECEDGDGTGGCFESTSLFAPDAAAADSKNPPRLRLRREAPSDASYAAFEIPKEENPQVLDWPDEAETRGTLVRVVLPDGTPYCHLKLFELRLKTGRPGFAGDPYDIVRIGFEVEAPSGRPDIVVPVVALGAATDAVSGQAFDGLYRLRHADERYLVRMMRMLPDET